MRIADREHEGGLKRRVAAARKVGVHQRPVAVAVRGRGADERPALAKTSWIREDPIQFDGHAVDWASRAGVCPAKDAKSGVSRGDDRVWRIYHFNLAEIFDTVAVLVDAQAAVMKNADVRP